jgi:hypothetical protein
MFWHKHHIIIKTQFLYQPNKWFSIGNVSREWDGASAVLKRRLWWEQLQNPQRRLQCVEEVVSFLEECLSTWVLTSYSQNRPKILWKFWNIAIDDVDRSNPHGYDSIPCFFKFHFIYSISIVDPTKLMVQDLAWFYPPCVMEKWEECHNSSHVLPWQLIKFKPSNNRLVRTQMDEFE